MSIKAEFIDYVERCSSVEPMPESLRDYWNKFKDANDSHSKDGLTENGKKILTFLQENTETNLWKSKDIAEGLFLSSRTVSGAIRKLVTDGFVEKVGQDPVIYSITEKGKQFTIN